MNPFLHSTVAQPLPPDEARWGAPRCARQGQADTDPQRTEGLPTLWQRSLDREVDGSKKHPRWRQAARHVALAASIGMVAYPAHATSVINVDVATVQELQNVRGIGPKTAEMIVRERERAGPFESFQDFAERIRGIGPKRAQALREAGLTASSSAPRRGGPLPPGLR